MGSIGNRLLVVETDPEVFAHWSHPDYGVGAQLEALGHDGSQIVIEQLTTADELNEVAHEVKAGDHLPARALVFGGVQGSELAKSPVRVGLYTMIDAPEPPDYDEENDPVWAWRGDEGKPLTPQARLIANRLIQRAAPDVRFFVFDEEYDDPEPVAGLFGYRYAMAGHSELAPDYAAYLRRVNRHAAATEQDFMSLVNVGDYFRPHAKGISIEGTDLDLRNPFHEELIVDPVGTSLHSFDTVRQIGVVARLTIGAYPGATEADARLVLPRYTETAVSN